MRAAQERGQECLPPKKRDLPAAATASEERGEASTGRGGRPSQAAPCYGEGGGGSSPEAVAGLTLDQYGLLYKVAVPPASFSPVVNVSPLPPAFGMAASQLLPPQPYSPLHYTQLPPALLQFVGSHYSVPYTVPPGFLPGPLLPASSLAASHIPHLVPTYAPLLAEDPPPPASQAALPAHSFAKSSASVSPSGLLQQPPPPHVSSQPLDGAQARIPVYYQMSHLPAGYSPFDTPIAGPSSEQPLRDGQLHPKIVTANGVQRPAIGSKENEALDVGNSKAEGQWPRTLLACSTDAALVVSSQAARTEASAPSQRSTPDMDLEVQRVVGVLASPDYSVGSARRKDGLSPLNLSHREPTEQKGESVRNPAEPPEKSHLQRLSTKSPEEQFCHQQVLKGLMMTNGEQASGSLQPAALDGPGRTSSGVLLDVDCGPSQGHLPSHFMKGAIIQLATGELKRVEDLQTQDFVRSAEVSGGLKIDSSTVVDVQESPWQGFVTLHFVVGEQQSKVSIDVPPEHPFFVYGQGWSSCSPERTARLFSLSCHRLQVGDVCISISLQSLNGRLASQASPQGAARERLGRGSQGLREPQVRAREKSLVEKGGAGLGSPQEPPRLEPLALHGWAGPSFQRFGEESWPPLLRPSFIPQEVKLSIEGRSNAGK
ncbi:ataxin-1-like [Tiliqua scincoides]|uniref:ataxin-1-like n=1 Tax=Tiliqua scincoides TaxID=71010 RepID=UPI0034622929